MRPIKKVVVVMGGPSEEQAVSHCTGQAVVQALREKGYSAETLELDPLTIAGDLLEKQPTVVFNAVHGLYGEDGCLQGLLDMLQIPYTGSGVLASALAMNKVAAKRIFQAAGLTTPHSVVISTEDKEDAVAKILAVFQLPVVVKPVAQGSSIGVEIVRAENALAAALQNALGYSKEVLVEEFIQGKELTVGILPLPAKAVAMPVIHIVPHSGVYDYKSKYTKGETDYLVPADLPETMAQRVQAAAVSAYKLLGCHGVARADIMLGEDEQAYVLELNTVPGLTATSLVPKAAAAMGISFPELCEIIIQSAFSE